MQKLLVGLVVCAAGANASAGYVSIQSEAVDQKDGTWLYTYTVSNSLANPYSVHDIVFNLFNDTIGICLPGYIVGAACHVGLGTLQWTAEQHPSAYIDPGVSRQYGYLATYAPIAYRSDFIAVHHAVTGYFDKVSYTETFRALGPGSPQALAAFGVPEPSSLALAALALGGLVLSRRR